MTSVKISALPAAATITGGELVPVVQSGVTKGATAAQIAATVTSAAIAAALGYTPANIAGDTFTGPILAPNGTAAAPALSFVNNTALGFYRSSADILGVAVKGLQTVTFRTQNVLGTDDGMILQLGRAQTHSGAEAYPSTLFVPTQTMSSTSAAVVFSNLFPSSLVAGASGTYASKSFNIELDKVEVSQTGGAATFSGGVGGVRVHVPIAKTSVTLSSAIGISFTIPNSADVTGTHTTTKMIHFPTSSGGPSSTYYGLFFDAAYNGGAIGSGTNVPIYINSGGASGYVALGQNGGEALRVQDSTGNYIVVNANSTPMLLAAHASNANVGMVYATKGTSAHQFMADGGTTEQFRVTRTASSVNYLSATGAASGANPSIRASAENLQLGTGNNVATNATAGLIMIPGCQGTPTGAPTGASTGSVPMIADTTNHKLYFYSGGAWRDAGP